MIIINNKDGFHGESRILTSLFFQKTLVQPPLSRGFDFIRELLDRIMAQAEGIIRERYSQLS